MKDIIIWGNLVETADGSLTLRHPEREEEYHSSQGARFESENLYMDASGFRQAIQQAGEAMAVLDVGLGLGYNALTTLEAWWSSPGKRNLVLHSLEINPDLVAALADGSAPWLQGWSDEWLGRAAALKQVDEQNWTAEFTHPKCSKSKFDWTIRISDAAHDEQWNPNNLQFNWIWQDPFSPKKNPEMWSQAWFLDLKSNCKTKAVLVTYSVARSVRDALSNSGWDWQKLPAPGKKRQWLKASPG